MNLIQKFTNELTNKLIITVLESRPLNEGSTLAKNLLLSSLSTLDQGKNNNSIKIQLITDSSCHYFMSDVTCVLIGADKIYTCG